MYHNVDEVRAAQRANKPLRFIHFWSHRSPPNGRLGPHCFSQWYPSPFTVDDQRYPTAEHWMMAEKARLFGDDVNLHKILAAPAPGQAKALGRKVSGFDSAIWNAHKFAIVYQGSLHKFSNNPSLRAYLLSTGDRILVEASPQDCIWGIGLAAADPAADNPAQWQGENLLGFALMKARESLQSE